jgi:addiction module HigA family antidote
MAPRNKRRPTHPGELLREETLPAAGLTQSKLARLLGVSRRTVGELIRERRSVLFFVSLVRSRKAD